ncbi:CPBP family intramembrane metalloprotease [Bacteroidales bacterium OttesenSCG-928-L03]|nr:CPBP family intramembrane metalloprotease [Bacteroidales bacterium OttesenSCG-928-L03]MDL2241471.1 CPBP family intramembrane metalloprotease [Bacteroidales bacterium OttesenSCG-928-L03]
MKGAFKDTSPWIQLLILVVLCILGADLMYILACLFVMLQAFIDGTDIDQMVIAMQTVPVYMREVQFFVALGSFVFPALFSGYLFSDNYKTYLKLNTPVRVNVLLMTFVCSLVAIPAINFTTMLNQEMVLPEWMSGVEQWMKAAEEAVAKATEKILYAENIGALLMNILVVAILAGVGEELIFRGALLNIIGRIFRNPHVVIWIVAIIFSAVHMQFYGFLPRMLLGAYLGYLFYFTNNIWVPILAHFTNNAFVVVGYYLYQDEPKSISEQLDTFGYGDTWWAALASLALVLLLLAQIKKAGSKIP